MPQIEPFVFANAVRHFWRTRQRQARRQAKRASPDAGHRGAVTGGRQMDGFVSTLTELMEAVGVPREQIHTKKRDLVVPGFYRATKEWDILVVAENELRAVLELKSQVGPSFGNNLNNRVEEAVGSAEDIWTAFREGAFKTSRPWLGYLFMLEDCQESRSPVAVSEPHFDVFAEFKQASYAQRYEILCRKLVLERKYDAACFILSSPSVADDTQNYVEPAEDLSARRLLRSLLGRLSSPI